MALAAHPRVCGENNDEQRRATRKTGSPPRVRGKPAAPAPCRRSSGLTPACAGKTLLYRLTGSRAGAHPRVCGENSACDGQHTPASGSPPRVRGKRRLRGRRARRRGLTPACAGKTRPGGCPAPGTRAHPRVCGENAERGKEPVQSVGSPPRVRGKQVHPLDELLGQGLTPACAGKTGEAPGRGGHAPAHPRVCGENSMRITSAGATFGSPPRVRGKHVPVVLDLQGFRLTPACAGKTCRSPR